MMYFLIGMPGTGKTTFGRQLANVLEIPFMDTDAAIEAANQCSIPELFVQKGEAIFRAIEAELLHNIPTQSDAVVATGGGMACVEANLDYMLMHGKVIWCFTPLHHLTNRIWNSKKARPIFAGVANKEALKIHIEQLYEMRLAFYKKAHYHINLEKTTAKEVADILRYLP